MPGKKCQYSLSSSYTRMAVENFTVTGHNKAALYGSRALRIGFCPEITTPECITGLYKTVIHEKTEHNEGHRSWKFCHCRVCKESFSEFFKEFCEESSIHGLKYVGRRNYHIVVRIVWASFFIFAMVTALVFISVAYEKWENNPVIISTASDVSSVGSIPFPAITTCVPTVVGINLANELLDDRSPNYELNKQMLDSYCKTGKVIWNTTTTTEQMKKLEKEFIQQLVSCERYFRNSHLHIYLPDSHIDLSIKDYVYNHPFSSWYEGRKFCCTFNSIKPEFLYRNITDKHYLKSVYGKVKHTDWNYETGYADDADITAVPLRVFGEGFDNSLNITIDRVYCNPFAPSSYKITIHKPDDPPEFYKLIDIPQNVSTAEIEVTASALTTSKTFKKLRKEDRKCIFQSERHLRFFRNYTEAKCFYDFYASELLRLCGCYVILLPGPPDAPVCTEDRYRACNMDPYSFNNLKADCPQACRELTYTAELKTRKFSDLRSGELYVYFTDSRFLPLYRSEYIGLTEFIASIGGILGLFIGFSVLSFVEIFYFISLGFWRLFKRR